MLLSCYESSFTSQLDGSVGANQQGQRSRREGVTNRPPPTTLHPIIALVVDKDAGEGGESLGSRRGELGPDGGAWRTPISGLARSDREKSAYRCVCACVCVWQRGCKQTL
ncbi:hypothetical protein EYF80_057123 [Liparis tanakae]|uniref:Uncharacterized protein n=1 Tax=Liparis tanakae TaxID=230148 RepID=A0A4Z2EWH8_9TELE|nr:hypothetical protein EYF80_057123 [Liparis tanakae]